MALEWLKKILGEAYTDEIDKAVSAEIGKAFVSKTDFNTLNETKKTLEKTVEERDGQLEELKKLDPEKLQTEIARLQGENATAKTKYEEELQTAKLNFALENRLLKEGAVNVKAVRALLDGSKISLDGENIIGVDEQLKTLKENEKWAFSQVQNPKTGMPQGGEPGNTDDAKAYLDQKYANNPYYKK